VSTPHRKRGITRGGAHHERRPGAEQQEFRQRIVDFARSAAADPAQYSADEQASDIPTEPRYERALRIAPAERCFDHDGAGHQCDRYRAPDDEPRLIGAEINGRCSDENAEATHRRHVLPGKKPFGEFSFDRIAQISGAANVRGDAQPAHELGHIPDIGEARPALKTAAQDRLRTAGFSACPRDAAGESCMALQYRICFEWREGEAVDVEIVDYH
jgi:hypothetical protein